MSNTYDPTDPDALEREQSTRGEKVKTAAELELADIKWLVSTKRGRRIVWRFLESAGVFRLSFSSNSMQMAFNEGNRNSGNKLLSLVNTVSPEMFPVMIREAKEANEKVQ